MPQTYLAATVPIQKVRRANYIEREFTINISFVGRKGRLTVRSSPGTTPALVIDDPLINIASDRITVSCPATTMSNIKAGIYVYRLDVYTNDTDVQTIMEGQFEVIE